MNNKKVYLLRDFYELGLEPHGWNNTSVNDYEAVQIEISEGNVQQI